jgi:outer membrane protein assembly factor BamD
MRTMLLRFAVLLAMALTLSSCFRRVKYENPINADTQQPDKILFDKAVRDLEKGRYEVARLTLQTLINTYDSSEYLAKAKLAIADSWFREGGAHGLAQAEAEYKDFILFYPTMEEAAESQKRICDIHYRQMEKADRDPNNALRAEQECRQLLVQFPNSRFVPDTMQRLRAVQEVLAEAEMRVGDFYHRKGSLASAANRLTGVVDQYPLFSRADQALWLAGDSYNRMGPRFRREAGESYMRIVRDYPLSSHADDARARLRAMEMEIPEADATALARMRFEKENRTRTGLVRTATGFMRRGPDVSAAAKTGAPQMNPPRQNIPPSVPIPGTATGFQGEVTATPITGASALDTLPDARANPPRDDGKSKSKQ